MSIRLQNFSLSRSEPRADQPLPEPRVLAQHLPIDARFKSAEIGAHPPVQEKGRSFFTLGAPNNASASAFAARPAPPPQVGAQFAFSRGPAGAAGAQKLSFGSQANSTPAAAAAQQVAAQAAAAAAAAELRQVNMQFRAERADLVQKIQQSDAQTAQLRGVEAGLRSEIARLSGLIAESVPRERFESAVQSVLKADGMLLEQSKQVEDVTARLAQLEDVNAAAEQHLSEARAEGESVRTALAAVEARLESAASERDHYRQIHLQALEAKGQAEVSAECAAKSAAIRANTTVQIYMYEVSQLVPGLAKAATANCYSQLQRNRTCSFTLDWSKHQSLLDKYASAVQAVGSLNVLVDAWHVVLPPPE